MITVRAMLVEQVLASHSAVEPLGARPEIGGLADWLSGAPSGRAYPGARETLSRATVRRPIFRDAVDHSRRFEPWLDPLKAALGPTLETWRGET